MERRNFLKAVAAAAALGAASAETAKAQGGVELLQIYKCSVCGNVVELIRAGMGHPVCCGKPMNLLPEQMEGKGSEKHVPVIERTAEGIKVEVGSVPHPMLENHYIEWIELVADGHTCRKFLKPGDRPEATFKTAEENFHVRAFCNIHLLWKGK